jgi:hypothetical protein
MMSASMPAADVLDDRCQFCFWRQNGASSLQLSCNSIEKTAARYREGFRGCH